MMNNIQIRPAVCGDELILAQIQTEAWKTAFANILPADELEKDTNPQKVIDMYTRVLQQKLPEGYLLFVDGNPHIHSLQGNWGKGYGSTMMEFLLEKIKSAGYRQVILWVFEENVRARRFYEKHGFVMTEHRKNHFGADEVLYQKSL